MKIIKKNQLKIVIYTAVKISSVLHGRVFVTVDPLNGNTVHESSLKCVGLASGSK